MTATATAPKPRSRKTRSGGIGLNAATLARAIHAVDPAVPTRSPKPVLGNVLLADGYMTGTDLEIRISVPIPEADGPPMLLPFARLKAISSTLSPSDEVRLAVEGTSCIVTAGGGEWRLPVEDVAEFPPAPADTGTSIGRLPGDQFAALMDAVKFATDNESSRYALGAVCVSFEPGGRDDEEGKLTFVATDGRRLAAASATLAAQDLDASETLLPRRAVDAACRLASRAAAVQMTATRTEVILTIGDYAEGQGVTGTVLRARLTEGRFPRWRDVDVCEVGEPMPRRYSEPATFAVAGSLLHAIKMASICTSESSKGVDIAITEGGLVVTAQAAETGTSRVECELAEVGHQTTVKIDPRFAREWLDCGSIDSAETVSIEARDPQSAIVFRCGECRTVVMPMSND